MQKLSGRKKTLTKVKSLMFSFKRVEVRLSTIALALKSCHGQLALVWESSSAQIPRLEVIGMKKGIFG